MGERDIDREVAEKVMGWPKAEYITDEMRRKDMPIYGWRNCHLKHELESECEHQWYCGKETYYPAPRYASDPAAMMQVIEKMRDNGWTVSMTVYPAGSKFLVIVTAQHPSKSSLDLICKDADTLPRAVCLAALKALGGEQDAD